MEIARDGGHLIFAIWREDREMGPMEIRLAGYEEEDFFLEVRTMDSEDGDEEWSEWREYELDDQLGIGALLVEALGQILADQGGEA